MGSILSSIESWAENAWTDAYAFYLFCWDEMVFYFDLYVLDTAYGLYIFIGACAVLLLLCIFCCMTCCRRSDDPKPGGKSSKNRPKKGATKRAIGSALSDEETGLIPAGDGDLEEGVLSAEGMSASEEHEFDEEAAEGEEDSRAGKKKSRRKKKKKKDKDSRRRRLDSEPLTEDGAGRPSSRAGSHIARGRDDEIHSMEEVAMSFVQVMRNGIKIDLFLPGKSKPKPMTLILKDSLLVWQRDPAGKAGKSCSGGSCKGKQLDQASVYDLTAVDQASPETVRGDGTACVELRFADGQSLVFSAVGNGHSGDEEVDGETKLRQANNAMHAMIQGFTLILTAKEANELDRVLGKDVQEGKSAGLPSPVPI
mmetsp:Transcript_51904/g.75936  ORF Transcript_51904/g.75936 Transcript_51904/m.75936 type:complete len:367 (-) Transcript_51904:118-1218(-)|eukprot:CAMPEP_0194587380 /NCGR_PEP_ID=MMETSP0292-20121207/19113_1 /TAXON_ID=39354 /ORGANISM="Heterosigma akashiwo, Strain CCMP2393" /LENGTH=366 /DNA_ID=CAMNT_0039443607 /DNA_START=82 /DNA_END=1182 /DNA_ORIENTATION=-